MPVQASADRAGEAVRADAGRVAAIRNGLDVQDPASVAELGERPRRELAVCIGQVRNDGRDADFNESLECLRHLRSRIDQLDPAALQVRRGLAGLFDSRGRRLKRFRERFVDTVREAAAGAADLTTRTARMNEAAAALNALHDQTRAALVELDACISAGRARLGEAPSSPAEAPGEDGAPAAVSGTDQLAARLERLAEVRAAALGQLPLVRMMQNAGAFAAQTLEGAMAAVTVWREEWAQALAMDRRSRVRPDVVWLDQARRDVDETLARAEAAVIACRNRRAEAGARMARHLETTGPAA